MSDDWTQFTVQADRIKALERERDEAREHNRRLSDSREHAIKERDEALASLANTQIAWENWKVVHSTTLIDAERVKALQERDEARALLRIERADADKACELREAMLREAEQQRDALAEALRKAQDELALARKLHWLAAQDHIFFSSYNGAIDDWDDGAHPAINCNDVFIPGADAEGLAVEDVDLYVKCVKQFGDEGRYGWCAAKRAMNPWRAERWSTTDLAKFNASKAWCEQQFAARAALAKVEAGK